jgi:predicted ribosome quality control (RQC) complex YloA/Tae2 family protein|tara:strand:+ start:1448 stop:1660 length:213 start_codon:yes stop_codon:yes gene_type:complete
MNIDEQMLKEEKKTLEDDFNTMSNKIKQVEVDLGTMRSNLNAVYGAIQQVEKLLKKINMVEEETKEDEKI